MHLDNIWVVTLAPKIKKILQEQQILLCHCIMRLKMKEVSVSALLQNLENVRLFLNGNSNKSSFALVFSRKYCCKQNYTIPAWYKEESNRHLRQAFIHPSLTFCLVCLCGLTEQLDGHCREETTEPTRRPPQSVESHPDSKSVLKEIHENADSANTPVCGERWRRD